MLEFKDTPKGILVSSKELYNKIRIGQNHYSRWLSMHVVGVGLKDKDYFEGYRVKTKTVEAKDVWVSLEFARSLCLITKTKKALEIRNWLLTCELTTSN